MDQARIPPRILFAEDDTIARDNFSVFFNRVGWNYKNVKSGGEALEAIKTSSFDVIITDVQLPGADKLSLLKDIQVLNPGQAVIVVTSAYSIQELVDLLQEGAADVIHKPVDFDSLERSVARLIWSSHHKTPQENSYRFTKEEKTSFCMTSEELASTKLPLLIAHRLARANLIDSPTKLKLELAFQEAITNSLEHGNLELESQWKEEFEKDGTDRYSVTKRKRLQDPRYGKREVMIDVHYVDRSLTVVIKDGGRGFDQKKLSLPKQHELAGHGRGLAIISAVMDEVRYDQGGTRITMVKKF